MRNTGKGELVSKVQVRDMIKSSVAKTPLKYIDTTFNFTITTSGTIINLNLPGIQGTANGQRVGDEIEIESFQLREHIMFGDSTGNSLRVIHMQSVGSSIITAANEVLSNDFTGNPGVTSMYQSFVEKSDIRILQDKLFVSIPNASNGQILTNVVLKPKISRIAFDSGSTSSQNGQTQVLVISDSSIIPNPGYYGVWRLYYRDV